MARKTGMNTPRNSWLMAVPAIHFVSRTAIAKPLWSNKVRGNKVRSNNKVYTRDTLLATQHSLLSKRIPRISRRGVQFVKLAPVARDDRSKSRRSRNADLANYYPWHGYKSHLAFKLRCGITSTSQIFAELRFTFYPDYYDPLY